jgi:hypothetical protein
VDALYDVPLILITRTLTGTGVSILAWGKEACLRLSMLPTVGDALQRGDSLPQES